MSTLKTHFHLLLLEELVLAIKDEKAKTTPYLEKGCASLQCATQQFTIQRCTIHA